MEQKLRKLGKQVHAALLDTEASIRGLIRGLILSLRFLALYSSLPRLTLA